MKGRAFNQARYTLRLRRRARNIIFVAWLLFASHAHLAAGFGGPYFALQACAFALALGGYLALAKTQWAWTACGMLYACAKKLSPAPLFMRPLLRRGNSIAVVARYNEDLAWIKHLPINAVVYNKGGAVQPGCKVIQRPNHGRETESYLRYIIDNYHNLPERIVFVQGNPFDHCWWFFGALRCIRKPVEFLGKKRHGRWRFLSREIKEAEEMAYQILPHLRATGALQGRVYHAPGAQYAVARECITAKPLEWWRRAYALCTDYQTFFPENGEYMNGAVFERLWPLIWQHQRPAQ